MTADETPNNDDIEIRERMRKRFQELDEQQRKREEAGAAWVFVGYFGFLVTFIGVFMMAVFLGFIPLSLEIIISSGVILFGILIIAVSMFLRNSPNIILAEM